MIKNLIIFGIQVIVITSFTSCFVNVEKTYTTSSEEICNCYTKSNLESSDERITECIKSFNIFINELPQSSTENKDIEQFGKEGLLIIMNELTKRCPAYRKALLQLSLDKFGNIPKNEALETIVKSKQESELKIDTLKLIDSYFSISKKEKANKLLDLYISKHNNSNYALWMKSCSLYKDKKISESVAAIDSAIKVTKNMDMKSIFELYKNTINPLVTDRNDKITIKYNLKR